MQTFLHLEAEQGQLQGMEWSLCHQPPLNPTCNTQMSHKSLFFAVDPGIEPQTALVDDAEVVRFPRVTSRLPVVLALTTPHSHLE